LLVPLITVLVNGEPHPICENDVKTIELMQATRPLLFHDGMTMWARSNTHVLLSKGVRTKQMVEATADLKADHAGENSKSGVGRVMVRDEKDHAAPC
jgi:hypothetical protein